MKDGQHYQSDAFAAIHETLDALHQAGVVGKKTMRDFDDLCLSGCYVITVKA